MQTALFRVKESVAGARFSFIGGQHVRIKGRLPASLAGIFERVDTLPSGFTVMDVDAQRLEEGEERTAVAPPMPDTTPMGRRDVCREMGWTDAALDLAIAHLNFPKAQMHTSHTPFARAQAVWSWSRHDVRQWADVFRQVSGVRA